MIDSIPFLITERDEPDGARRLTLTGELDIASGPKLRERLRELGAAHRTVRLDLSRLDFMDSTGVHIMLFGIRDAARDGWNLEVDPNVSEHVRRVSELVGLGRHLWPSVQ